MNKLRGQQFSLSLGFLLLAISAGKLFAGVDNYSFEGSLDGWTNVRTNTVNTPPKADSFQPFENVTPHSADSNSPSTLDGTGASGVWQVAPDVSSFTENCCAQDNQPQTLVLTSPQFTLDATASITFALTGGTGAAASPATGNFNTLPTATSGSGFEGVALRNSVTGAYLLSATKATVGESYVQLGFTNAELSAAGVLGNGTQLQLDLINNFNGGWGWVALDNVTINGAVTPEPASLVVWGLVIAGGLVAARRRRKV